ncbi:hypothetical protein [Ornithinimicrobium pekingense]|uniref:Uncharacterized protein n=1 Tax=Ornithinimicrobium pekingense TaxID=384677 RepID=A0ABQ2FF39_9MICO|nr:hypothetical protein [Ornithinimicrobium pekingense]GGK81666.1 hypothetical protein GCM10011509_32630 [Ornithinimicrobium pekingense]
MSGADPRDTASDPGQGPARGPVHARRRRHRRVDAPPTNPEADRADDVPAGPRATRPATPPPGLSPDARDAWIRDQRPPHWD